MSKREKLILFEILTLIVITLSSCKYDGNKVELSADPVLAGHCVSARYPSYEALPYDLAAQGKVGALHSPGFPQNILMPEQSPLCLAVTITNTNHGHDSNNIVVFGSGLQISYTLDGKDIKQTIYDPLAADINIENASQTAGIISVFDPENCVTVQGKHVKLLEDNFHTCRFYLQITDSSYHVVRDHKITLNLQYSNGDKIFNTKTEVNYLAQIFLAQKDYPLVQAASLQDEFKAWKFNKNTDPAFYAGSDNLGNLYVFTANNLYIYQGDHLLYHDKLVIRPRFINFDSAGNCYISDGRDLYILNIGLYKNGKTMATMLAVLPQEVKTVGAINYYKNNTYIVANDNKLYKYSGHSWDLFFDGDNYKDLHSQKINNFYFVNDQTILLAVAGNLFEYYRIESQLQAVKINTPAVNQEIEHIFDLNNNLYVAYQSNSAGESKSVLYKHINYNNYFEPLLHLRAEQINGGLVLSGLNSLCLFGTNIYEAGEDALPAAPAGNNFICIADDKNLTTVNGINSEVMAAFGFGSFK